MLAGSDGGDFVIHATVGQVLVAVGSGRDFDRRSLTLGCVVQLGTEAVGVDARDAVVEGDRKIEARIPLSRSFEDHPPATQSVEVLLVEEDQVPLVSTPESGGAVTEAQSRATLASFAATAAGVDFTAVETQADGKSCLVVGVADRGIGCSQEEGQADQSHDACDAATHPEADGRMGGRGMMSCHGMRRRKDAWFRI